MDSRKNHIKTQTPCIADVAREPHSRKETRRQVPTPADMNTCANMPFVDTMVQQVTNQQDMLKKRSSDDM